MFFPNRNGQRDTILLEDRTGFEFISGNYPQSSLANQDWPFTALEQTIFSDFADSSFAIDLITSDILPTNGVAFGVAMKNPRMDNDGKNPPIIMFDGVLVLSQRNPLACVPFVGRLVSAGGDMVTDVKLLPVDNHQIAGVGNPGGVGADFSYISHFNTQFIIRDFNQAASDDENQFPIVLGFILANLSNDNEPAAGADIIRGRISAYRAAAAIPTQDPLR